MTLYLRLSYLYIIKDYHNDSRRVFFPAAER